MKKSGIERFGEFIGYSIVTIVFITLLALAGLAWYGIWALLVWLAS